jgi:arginine repressor
MLKHIIPAAVLVLIATTVAAAAAQTTRQEQQSSRSARLERALAGELTKVDESAKTLVIRTAAGTDEVLKITEGTVVRDLKEGAHTSALAGKEGTHVVVHYSEEGAEKVARAVNYVGGETLKVAAGAVTKFDRAGRTLMVKTADGANETFHLAENATIELAQRIVRFSEASFREGERVTVHYTEEAGHKIAHLIKDARSESPGPRGTTGGR